MQRASSRKVVPAVGWILLTIVFAMGARAPAAAAGHVEFDFVRGLECRDVTPPERAAQYPMQRLIEFTLPVSVRFRDMAADEVDEITIEITSANSGMLIHSFAPATTLASDIVHPIESTTTTKSGRSLDATLGGQLPVPYGELAANVAPSISGGLSSGETVTEKMNRLPPRQAIVVSGTTYEGRGVFFKLRRSSQTSLEGVHDLAITLITPSMWRGANVQVGCSARGERKLLWVIKQDATLGSEGDRVRLYLAGRGVVRQVAKPVVAELSEAPRWITSREARAAEVVKKESKKPTVVANATTAAPAAEETEE